MRRALAFIALVLAACGELAPANIVDVHADAPAAALLEWVGSPGEMRTVAVTITPSMDAEGNQPPALGVRDLYADLEWGSYLTPSVARVDVRKGVRLVLEGDHLAVRVGIIGGDARSPIRVAGWVVLDAERGASATATRTLFVDDLGEGETSNPLVVPAFAHALLAVERRPVDSPARLRVLSIVGTPVFEVEGDTDAPMLQAPLILPSFSYSVDVTNHASHLTSLQFVFSLAL